MEVRIQAIHFDASEKLQDLRQLKLSYSEQLQQIPIALRLCNILFLKSL